MECYKPTFQLNEAWWQIKNTLQSTQWAHSHINNCSTSIFCLQIFSFFVTYFCEVKGRECLTFDLGKCKMSTLGVYIFTSSEWTCLWPLIPKKACGDERITCGHKFSSSITWVPGIAHELPGFPASALTSWGIYFAYCTTCKHVTVFNLC